MCTALRSEKQVETSALRIVLRDMGNGVTRIESCQLLERPLVVVADCPELLRVVPPLGHEMEDLLGCALASLGLDPSVEYGDCWARSVCDGITELHLW